MDVIVPLFIQPDYLTLKKEVDGHDWIFIVGNDNLMYWGVRMQNTSLSCPYGLIDASTTFMTVVPTTKRQECDCGNNHCYVDEHTSTEFDLLMSVKIWFQIFESENLYNLSNISLMQSNSIYIYDEVRNKESMTKVYQLSEVANMNGTSNTV